MRPLNKIAFVLDNIDLRSPGQQLLDRFLIGFQENGVFNPAPRDRIIACCPPSAERTERVNYFNLAVTTSIGEATRSADLTVVVSSDEKVQRALHYAPKGSVAFAYGAGASKETLDLAAKLNIQILTGTVALTLSRLPALEIPKGTHLREALIVVQGKYPDAELDALDSLFPFIGADGIRARHFAGDEVWRAGDRKDWSWELLSAALSRTDKPQGHALLDGRTEDMVGLGLVQKMATAPHSWQLENTRGLRTTILVLDGVVGDTVVAFRTAGGPFSRGQILSTQLFRSPAPQEEHYSRLASAILDYFQTGRAPWSPSRTREVPRLLSHFADPESQTPNWRAIATS